MYSSNEYKASSDWPNQRMWHHQPTSLTQPEEASWRLLIGPISDGSWIVPGPLGRARSMAPIIFLDGWKGGNLTTTVGGVFFPLTANVRDLFPSAAWVAEDLKNILKTSAVKGKEKSCSKPLKCTTFSENKSCSQDKKIYIYKIWHRFYRMFWLCLFYNQCGHYLPYGIHRTLGEHLSRIFKQLQRSRTKNKNPSWKPQNISRLPAESTPECQHSKRKTCK